MKRRKNGKFTELPLSQTNFGPMKVTLHDPLGSYTGRPVDPMEKPVQDADDL